LEIYKLEQYNTTNRILTGTDAPFRILDKTITPFNRMVGDRFDYMLHSKYSTLHAKLVVPYTNLGSTADGLVRFYSIDRYGVETLITEYETSAGDEVIDVEVDLRGVEIFRIKFYSSEALYNVTLEGMK
jgi:hypothetical protein